MVEEEIWACDRRGPCDSFDSLEPFAVYGLRLVLLTLREAGACACGE